MAELDPLLSEYLGEGRRLEREEVAKLNELWLACRKYVHSDGAAGAILRYKLVHRLMRDIEAELTLRGLEPPPPRGKLLN
jgi:hypothetical protein